MTQINQIIEMQIEGLGHTGNAYGMFEGLKIFVPGALPGDVVEAKIKKISKKFNQATLIKIVTPSKHRIDAVCKHFYSCGGCSLQHLDSESYYEFKQGLLISSITSAGLDPSVVAPIIKMQPKTRRRTDLKVSINHNTVEIGYCKQYSHAIINITECHVLEPVIFNLLPALKEMILGLDEPRLVTELSVLNSDSGIDLVIRTTSWATITDLERLVEFANNQDLARISWQNSEQLHLVCCRRSVLLKHNNASVPIMAGSFLQATKQAETIITELVVQYTTGYKSIVDLYAGFGTYSFPMRDYANVHAVEGSKIMVEAIKTAVKDYPAEHTLTAKSQDIFKYPLQPAELSGFDCAVVNPPRNGAEPQVRQLALAKVPAVLMVSCDHISFSRDAKILSDAGYHLQAAHAVDQFLWSPHIEIVAMFKL